MARSVAIVSHGIRSSLSLIRRLVLMTTHAFVRVGLKVLATIVVLQITLLVALTVSGFAASVVPDRSMDPALSEGTLLIVRPLVGNLESGATVVVTQDGITVPRRVVETFGTSAIEAVAVRRDSETDADAVVVLTKDVGGRVIFSAPYVGSSFLSLQEPVVILNVVALFLTMLLIDHLGKRRWRRAPVCARPPEDRRPRLVEGKWVRPRSRIISSPAHWQSCAACRAPLLLWMVGLSILLTAAIAYVSLNWA